MLHIYPYLLHTLRIYSNFALFSGSIGLCYHESGKSAFPDMSELVDQSDTSVWNCGTGAALNQPRSQRLLFLHSNCYGVETHKQEQPCTDLADPQDTYILESK
ncbi:hypothetical protein T02_3936, partial [Trichinella nativa]